MKPLRYIFFFTSDKLEATLSWIPVSMSAILLPSFGIKSEIISNSLRDRSLVRGEEIDVQADSLKLNRCSSAVTRFLILKS